MSKPNKKQDAFNEVLFKPLKGLLSVVSSLVSRSAESAFDSNDIDKNYPGKIEGSGYRHGHQGFGYYQGNSRADLDDE